MPDSLEEHNKQVPNVRKAMRNTLQWLKKQEERAETKGEKVGYKTIRLDIKTKLQN